MVKLTIDLIARGTSGYTKKKRDESMHQYLKRLTHLYLEDRCIDEVVTCNSFKLCSMYINCFSIIKTFIYKLFGNEIFFTHFRVKIYLCAET